LLHLLGPICAHWLSVLFNYSDMIKYVLLMSRQGKVRLSKWYNAYSQKERALIIRDASNMVLNRLTKQCNFLEWQGGKLIYKRYASLYFVVFVDNADNELLALEIIHHWVEILDRYFGNVCELDLIFNFHKAYFILDELLIAGELQETSKREVLKHCAAQDAMMDPKAEGNLDKSGAASRDF